MRLILGTKNPGKLREFFEIAKSISELKLELPPETFDPKETGSTFAENALLKGREAAHLTQTLSIGEDSGIEVDALGGEPGILSARYCRGSDTDRCRKLLLALAQTPVTQRGAAYICAMALVSAKGDLLYQTSGKWQGQIAFAEKGSNGFGYDPIFYLPEHKKTAAELSSSEKNQISHRAQAWTKMLDFLRQFAAVANKQ